MVNLPFDVLFAIIEEIGMQERPDFDLLWAFCLTCGTLRPRAQAYLFHSLSLEFTTSEPHSFGACIAIYWKHMELIIKGNPQVAACVKYVRFRAGSRKGVSPNFVSLLSKFTMLKKIRCGYHNDHLESWTALNTPQKQQWETIFRLPSIHRLQIVGFAFIPISVLFSCTNLQSLYIDSLSTFDGPELAGSLNDVHRPLPNLTSVQTTWDITSLKPLFTVYPTIGAPLVEKSSIKYMFLKTISDGDCSKLRDFPSLRSFDVDISQFLDPTCLFTNFHPSSLESLNWLGLEFNWNMHVTGVYPSMVLAAALGRQPGLPNLTRVVVTVTLDWNQYSSFKDGEMEELGELDRLFASRANFPRLHTVTIVLQAYTEKLMKEVTGFWVKDSGNIAKYLPLFAARLNCELLPLVRLSP